MFVLVNIGDFHLQAIIPNIPVSDFTKTENDSNSVWRMFVLVIVGDFHLQTIIPTYQTEFLRN
jgi:hypothetical protein